MGFAWQQFGARGIEFFQQAEDGRVAQPGAFAAQEAQADLRGLKGQVTARLALIPLLGLLV